MCQGLSNIMMSKIFSSLGRYFFSGLLTIAPLVFTFYSLYFIFNIIDEPAQILFKFFFGFSFQGLGLLSVLILVICTGFLSTQVLVRPLFSWIESLLNRTPFVKIIYTSIKDLFSAFMSDKKKFNKPVLVEMVKGSGLYKIGFVTDADLTEFKIENKLAVYFPHSYNFSGNLYIINAEQVQPITGVNTADIMKYVVSGGVTNIHEILEAKKG